MFQCFLLSEHVIIARALTVTVKTIPILHQIRVKIGKVERD